MTTFAVDSADAVIPLALDVVWLLAALVWLLIPVAIAVAERRREAPWPETFLWFMVPFCLPVVGLIIWAFYRAVEARRATSR
ncbi:MULTISPECIES: hypothetical protein [Dietzia]|uniref:Phospholipase D-like protein n=1 Tax=Dietzia cinnamea TaxID=321318 RepID=A0AAW5QE09_9ACTN|nr:MULTISPECIES: hypothetical protein [Dietzia]MBM7232049.1 hypothetical protein [Dietzia cinnamea]MCT1865696.1 hypothetical protein [Dietzia cinnamea]MCT2031797.1 hypothetical protein [Dietzia cinnamea]MCT2035198.1 hypothetical protein [Dietzia cinnamea]MCT2063369.1 hypothetical protein [Dietzia cinnamea]